MAECTTEDNTENCEYKKSYLIPILCTLFNGKLNCILRSTFVSWANISVLLLLPTHGGLLPISGNRKKNPNSHIYNV